MARLSPLQAEVSRRSWEPDMRHLVNNLHMTTQACSKTHHILSNTAAILNTQQRLTCHYDGTGGGGGVLQCLRESCSSFVHKLQEKKSMQALAVVLQHPAVALDQRNICTLLQVSKASREAIQQSVTSMLDCTFQSQVSLEKLSPVISFAGWLAKHARLVCRLSILPQGYNREAKLSELSAAINQLVEFALQAAACGAAAPTWLQSYQSLVPASAGLIAALPAATLTHLELQADNSNWFTPLGRLTHLQHLSLGLSKIHPGKVNSCLQEIGKLRQLTQLQLEGLATESKVHVLPAQLQCLHLEYKVPVDASISIGAHVNLQHLTSLQRLQLNVGILKVGSSWPLNLQSLKLHADWPAAGGAGLSSLHQVTAIELTSCAISREHLEALQHLCTLRNLSLSLQYHGDLLDVAAAWHSLPLYTLEILAETSTANELQLMQHVATATRLTKLELMVETVNAAVNDHNRLAICEQLQALKYLSNLSINIGDPDDFVEHDTRHLSALVTLTSLELCSNCYGPCIDEAIVCLLAVSLTELRALAINVHGEAFEQQIEVISALPAVGKLTTLEVLQLQGLPSDEARRGLQFLTGLSGLTRLQGFVNAGEAAMQEFRATIRGLQQEHCR